MNARSIALILSIALAAVGAGVAVRGATIDRTRPLPASTAAASAPAAARQGSASADDARAVDVATPAGHAARPSASDDPIAPPATGRYTYRADVNGESSTTTLSVLAASAPRPHVVRQIERHLVDGRWTNDVVDWSRTGAAVTATSSAGGRCDYDRPLTIVPAQLALGTHWDVASTCTATADGERVTLTRVEHGEVRDRATTSYAGTRIMTWFIARTASETEQRSGSSITATMSSTELFAPSLGVAVYRVSRTDLPGDDGSVASIASSLELLSFSPR